MDLLMDRLINWSEGWLIDYIVIISAIILAQKEVTRISFTVQIRAATIQQLVDLVDGIIKNKQAADVWRSMRKQHYEFCGAVGEFFFLRSRFFANLPKNIFEYWWVFTWKILTLTMI